MKNKLFLALSLTAIAAVIGCTTMKSPRRLASTPPPRLMIIVSLDGVGYNQLAGTEEHPERALDVDFVKENGVKPLLPPSNAATFPGHATMGTGVDILDSGSGENKILGHGICGNHNVFKPEGCKLDYLPGKAPKDLNDPKTLGTPADLVRGRGIYKPADLKVMPIWTDFAKRGFQVRTFQWALADGDWDGVHHMMTLDGKPIKYPDYRNYVFSDPDKKKPDVAKYVLGEVKDWKATKNLIVMARARALDDVGHESGPGGTEATGRSKVLPVWQKERADIKKFYGDLFALLAQKKGVSLPADIDAPEKAEMKAEITKAVFQDVLVLFVSDHGMSPRDKCVELSDPYCEFYKRAGPGMAKNDQGYHGGRTVKSHALLTPQKEHMVNTDMYGIVWSWPKAGAANIKDMKDIKPCAYTFFGVDNSTAIGSCARL